MLFADCGGPAAVWNAHRTLRRAPICRGAWCAAMRAAAMQAEMVSGIVYYLREDTTTASVDRWLAALFDGAPASTASVAPYGGHHKLSISTAAAMARYPSSFGWRWSPLS